LKFTTFSRKILLFVKCLDIEYDFNVKSFLSWQWILTESIFHVEKFYLTLFCQILRKNIHIYELENYPIQQIPLILCGFLKWIY